jgi:hypothetical protein
MQNIPEFGNVLGRKLGDTGLTQAAFSKRSAKIQEDIRKVNKRIESSGNEVEKQNLTLRRTALERKKQSVDNISQLADYSRKTVNAIFVQGSSMKTIMSTNKKDMNVIEVYQEQLATENPLVIMLWGFIFGMMQLKEQLESMCSMFPKECGHLTIHYSSGRIRIFSICSTNCDCLFQYFPNSCMWLPFPLSRFITC